MMIARQHCMQSLLCRHAGRSAKRLMQQPRCASPRSRPHHHRRAPRSQCRETQHLAANQFRFGLIDCLCLRRCNERDTTMLLHVPWSGTRSDTITCFEAFCSAFSEPCSACAVTAAAFLCFCLTVGAHRSLRVADPTAPLHDGSLKGGTSASAAR